MTVLEIPLHMPMKLTMQLIQSQLRHREVHSVKIKDGRLIIEHDRKPTHEIIADIGNCTVKFFDV